MIVEHTKRPRLTQENSHKHLQPRTPKLSGIVDLMAHVGSREDLVMCGLHEISLGSRSRVIIYVTADNVMWWPPQILHPSSGARE